jgi:dTDP-glucose 4,6-dehydratase
METQEILVTGGAGFIGTNLVAELRKRGHSVFVADQYHTNLPEYRRTETHAANAREEGL